MEVFHGFGAEKRPVPPLGIDPPLDDEEPELDDEEPEEELLDDEEPEELLDEEELLDDGDPEDEELEPASGQ